MEDMRFVTICGVRRRRPPSVPVLSPYRVRICADEEPKLFCTCGRSRDQPWCDGSERPERGDTGPIKLVVGKKDQEQGDAEGEGENVEQVTCGMSCLSVGDSSSGSGPGSIPVCHLPPNQKWYLLCGCKYSAKLPFCDGSHIHVVDGYDEEAEAMAKEAAAADTNAPTSDATMSDSIAPPPST